MEVKSKGDISRPKNQSKNKQFCYQKQKVLAFFSSHTTTMFDAEKQTGICRPNICRHIAKLEEDRQIVRLFRRYCPISGFRAWFFLPKKRKSTRFFQYERLGQYTSRNSGSLDLGK